MFRVNEKGRVLWSKDEKDTVRTVIKKIFMELECEGMEKELTRIWWSKAIFRDNCLEIIMSVAFSSKFKCQHLHFAWGNHVYKSEQIDLRIPVSEFRDLILEKILC